MAPNEKQKYIDYSMSAIQSSRRENGLTITEIVRHIKLTTDDTRRFRPLFAKVRAATNHAINTGLLKRYRYRIQLRTDDDAMSSDASDGDSEVDEEDDGSSVGTADEAESSSDDCERHERRKTAPTRRVGKKPPKPRQVSTRTYVGVKRRTVDASSDDGTDSDEDNGGGKRRKLQQKSRRSGTSGKRVVTPRSKSSPAAKTSHGGGLSKVNAGSVCPEIGMVKVEVEGSSTRERLPLVNASTVALDLGKDGNTSGKRDGKEEERDGGSGVRGEWSGSHRMIKEEVDEERLCVPGISGTRNESTGMWEVKKEKAEEGNENQDGDGNEAFVSTVQVKVEKEDESNVKNEGTIKSQAE